MRDDLRRTCSEIWVVDCSPEGHQPEVATRIFQGVQQPVCIVLASRKHGKDCDVPAHVRFHAIPKGHRKAKFDALKALSLHGSEWVDCPSEWRAPFLPEAEGLWAHLPPLKTFFAYDGSGVMPGRTWIIAPDKETLKLRWERLQKEKNTEKKEVLFHPHEGGDKTISKVAKSGLAGHEYRSVSVDKDKQPVIEPARYGFRTYDRQWIIPDNRLINRPNPQLWDWLSNKQVHMTAPEDRTPTAGPAFSFTGQVPDLHHYHGRGGRVYPLWRDSLGKTSNIRPEILECLAKIYGGSISPQDMMAYLAAVMASPAFTKRFAADLKRPGLRVPVTADAKLFEEAVAFGREVVWLHCYGERFVDPKAGRPKHAPRMPKETAPRIPAAGAIPGAPEPLPDTIDFDREKKRLLVGKGYVENVTQQMWDYEVSGKHVIRQWFSYRRRDRSRPIIGDRRPPSPLEKIQPESWPAEYTTDLIDLLNVLGRLIALEPAQAGLLERICAGPLIDAAQFPVASATPKVPKKK